MDYEMIKQLAKEMGCKVTDLIPLAPQNDPFYTGTPSDWALAEWFAHLWRAFGYQNKVHIRRVHYQIGAIRRLAEPLARLHIPVHPFRRRLRRPRPPAQDAN